MSYEKELKELEIIAKENGGLLRAEDVVAFAKDKTTALHSRFDWDNSEAAHKWRLEQARSFIRITITMLEVEGKNTSIKAFVSLKTDRYQGDGGYRFMVQILSNANMREQMLQDALDELKTFQAKYSLLKELTDVMIVINKITSRKFNTVSPKSPDQSKSGELHGLG